MASRKPTKKKGRVPAKKKSSVSATPRVDPVVQVGATPQELQGRYSNFALLQHSKNEFVFDFLWRLGNEVRLASRIISSPAHAKALYEALGKNLKKYEKAHGKIARS